MLASDLMIAARVEAGYPALPVIDWDKWIEIYSTHPDKNLILSKHGFIAGIVTDNYMLMDGSTIALEVAWYVDPKYRNKGEGMKLYNEFEEWARLNQCEYVLMGRPVPGAKKVGMHYLKELN